MASRIIRDAFPCSTNFDKWWIKAKSGTIAQLIKDGRDINERILYVLKFESNNQTGHSQFTTEQLVKHGATIKKERTDLD